MKSKLVQISDIGKVITGKTPPTKNTEYFGTEIPFLTPSDIISESKYVHKTGRSLSKLGKELLSAIILPPNSISVSCIGSDMGKTVFIQENMITNQQFNSIVPNNLVDSEFLYYFFKSKRSFLKNLSAGGSAQPIVNKSLFEEIQFLLFPLEIQINAGKILSDLDSKIHNLQNQNKILEQIAHAIFQSWFVDFDGVTEWDDSELGKIPKGWSVKFLSEIVDISSGKRPNEKSKSATLEYNIPCYGASKIDYYVKEALIEKPILLTGRVGTLGIIHRVYSPCFPSDNTLILLPKDYLFFEFIYFNLKQIDFQSYNRGTSQPLITQTDLKKIKIIIPNQHLLKSFNTNVKEFFKKINQNDSQIDMVTKTRDTLLPKLMSGEIRV